MQNQASLSSRYVRVALLLIGAIGAGVGGWYWCGRERADGAITQYRDSDRAALKSMLQSDWYWLVAENATDFSVEYMFDHRAATYHYSDQSLSIAVYRGEHDEPAGFVTYHRLDGAHGRVQFLAVHEKYRRKGCGKKLLEYAVQQLQKQGVCFVELAVRQSNVRARALYKSLGFEETWRTPDGFVGYSKPLCTPSVLS